VDERDQHQPLLAASGDSSERRDVAGIAKQSRANTRRVVAAGDR
jgi:hypothetical protein